MADIFVSYSTVDRAAASAVVEALERQKWRVFWDRSIPAGKKWPDVLQQQLSGASCVLVLLTRESLVRSWVNYEASVALHRRTLVPLLLDPDLNPNRDLPEMYRDLYVASQAPDLDSLRNVGLQEPWVRAIRDLVVQGARKRRLLIGAIVASIVMCVLATSYIAVTAHDAVVSWQAGLRYAERGPYSKAENERLKRAIRGATSIDLLVVNANSFASTFREDLAVFFGTRGNRMRVLFADPDTEFYGEMMAMTTPGISVDQKAIDADKRKLHFSRLAILSSAGEAADAVQFRQYNTQFRLPIILIDRKYCFLTLRLTPDQAQETLRFELASPSAGTSIEQVVYRKLKTIGMFLSRSTQDKANVESCLRHFDEIWKGSKPFS